MKYGYCLILRSPKLQICITRKLAKSELIWKRMNGWRGEN